jgi:hypothetical protein
MMHIAFTSPRKLTFWNIAFSQTYSCENGRGEKAGKTTIYRVWNRIGNLEFNPHCHSKSSEIGNQKYCILTGYGEGMLVVISFAYLKFLQVPYGGDMLEIVQVSHQKPSPPYMV